MKWLVDYAARYTVRRLVAFVLLLALGGLGFREARAGTDTHPTSDEAYSHCMTSAAANAAALVASGTCSATYKDIGVHNVACIATSTTRYQENADIFGTNKSTLVYNPNCSRLQNTQTNVHNFTTNTCLSQPDHHDWTHPDGISTLCSDGCQYIVSGPPLGWSPSGSICSVGPTSPKPVADPDSDGDGVTDTHDEFPDDPGETTDSDGDGVGDNGDSAPDDPANGGDTPGDEDGDDEGDNAASGGGTCGAPPQCTGDGIACNQLFQQWKTRCAVESGQAKLAGTVTDCNAPPPPCMGDHFNCTTLYYLRQAACNDGGTAPGGDGEAAQEIRDMLKGDGNANAGQDGPGHEPGDLWSDDDGDWTPDDMGFGLSRSCPAPPTIIIGGQSRTLDVSGLCNLAGVIAALVLLMAAAHAMWAFTQS